MLSQSKQAGISTPLRLRFPPFGCDNTHAGSNTAGGGPEPGTSATTGVTTRGRSSAARGGARGAATAASKRSGNNAQRGGPCYTTPARREVGRITLDKQARASAVTSRAAREEEEAAINICKEASRKPRSRVGVPVEAPLSAGSSAGPRVSAPQVRLFAIPPELLL